MTSTPVLPMRAMSPTHPCGFVCTSPAAGPGLCAAGIEAIPQVAGCRAARSADSHALLGDGLSSRLAS